MRMRYISTSERSKQLLIGAAILGRRNNEPTNSQAYKEYNSEFVSWAAQWGRSMEMAAIHLQEQAFRSAQTF